MTAAPDVDEEEVVARAISAHTAPNVPWEERGHFVRNECLDAASAALAALAPLRQAERERAWLAGAEAMRVSAAALIRLDNSRLEYVAPDLLSEATALWIEDRPLPPPPSQGDAP